MYIYNLLDHYYVVNLRYFNGYKTTYYFSAYMKVYLVTLKIKRQLY